jgi:hypothetical protein
MAQDLYNSWSVFLYHTSQNTHSNHSNHHFVGYTAAPWDWELDNPEKLHILKRNSHNMQF